MGQVVGSDAQKIHLRGEQVGQNRRRGDFDHHTHRDWLLGSLLLFLEVLHHVGQDGFSLPQFAQRGDEGKQHPHRSQPCRPYDGPQLRAKHLRVPQRQPDAPQAQERIGLFFRLGQVAQLVRAQVEGANHHRAPLHGLDYLGIDLIVVFFGGRGGGLQVEELGAVEPNPVGSPAAAVFGLLGQLDVAHQLDPHAVGGSGFLFVQAAQLGHPVLAAADAPVVFLAGGLVRVEDDPALVGVQDHFLAAVDGRQERSRAHHRRDFQPLGHDGRVAARAAHFGYETLDVPGIERSHLAGGEAVGQHQHRRGQVAQLLAIPTQQLPQQAALDVEDVGGLFGKGAGQLFKCLGIAAQHAADGKLRRKVTPTYQLFDLAQQLLVLEHLQVGVEDGPVVRPQLLVDGVAVSGDLAPRGLDGLMQPLEFLLHGVAPHEATRNTKALVVQHQRFAQDHAGRNRDALKLFHRPAPSRSRNRPVSPPGSSPNRHTRKPR